MTEPTGTPEPLDDDIKNMQERMTKASGELTELLSSELFSLALETAQAVKRLFTQSSRKETMMRYVSLVAANPKLMSTMAANELTMFLALSKTNQPSDEQVDKMLAGVEDMMKTKIMESLLISDKPVFATVTVFEPAKLLEFVNETILNTPVNERHQKLLTDLNALRVLLEEDHVDNAVDKVKEMLFDDSSILGAASCRWANEAQKQTGVGL